MKKNCATCIHKDTEDLQEPCTLCKVGFTEWGFDGVEEDLIVISEERVKENEDWLDELINTIND